ERERERELWVSAGRSSRRNKESHRLRQHLVAGDTQQHAATSSGARRQTRGRGDRLSVAQQNRTETGGSFLPPVILVCRRCKIEEQGQWRAAVACADPVQIVGSVW
ncbi:hypothetical protein U1Q18_044005, partial [Sarracenia purpurea var. burkii]